MIRQKIYVFREMAARRSPFLSIKGFEMIAVHARLYSAALQQPRCILAPEAARSNAGRGETY